MSQDPHRRHERPRGHPNLFAPPQARKAAVTAGGCFALSGCAGVPVAPGLLRECSPAGFAATKELGLHPRAEWRVRVTNPVRKGVGLAIIREGPIEMETQDEARGDVPMEVRRQPDA